MGASLSQIGTKSPGVLKLDSDDRIVKANSTLFPGLANLGNTCYFNSIISALYASPRARKYLMTMKPFPVQDRKDIRIILRNLRALMERMASTRATVVNPKKLFAGFTQFEPSTWTMSQQQDAIEFLNCLLNLWPSNDRVSDDVSEDRNLSHLFEGILCHTTRCLICDSSSQREQRFYDVSIEVTAKLRDALDRILHKEYLKENEKYFCENCSMYQPAVRCAPFLRIPKILVFQLKRFWYDPVRSTLSKVNARMSFQLNLVLKRPKQNQRDYHAADHVPQRRYCRTQVVKKLLFAKGLDICRAGYESVSGTKEILDAMEAADGIGFHEDTEIRLRLFAVICHVGATLFSGHYVAVVRQQVNVGSPSEDYFINGDWCLIDDETVTPLSAEQMKSFCTGGNWAAGARAPPKSSSQGARYISQLLKNQNAYILFYEQIS